MVKDYKVRESLWLLRRPLQFLADLAVLCAAFFIAYSPAINIQVAEFYSETALRQLPFVVLVQFSALFLVGAYTLIWRYVSIKDIEVFLKAAAISAAILLAFRFLLTYSDFNLWQIPISVVLIDTVLAFGGLLGLRILRRAFYELKDKNRYVSGSRRIKRRQVLIVGAGRMGATLAKEMFGRVDGELEICGFVDDDIHKVGGSVNRIKVLGTTDDLPRLVDELEIKQVVIAIDHAQGKEIRRVVDLCSSMSLRTQIVPSLNEIAHGRISISRIRDVQIEDLLGREPVELEDKNLHEFLGNKTVMVTGAGGSIGSELVRQIINYEPKRILLVERAEFFLFQITRELGNTEVECVPLIADICDEARMREIFEKHRPDVIFHAGAHKHVPLMEINSSEAIKNNVFATQLVGKLAGEFDSSDFVLISTDKAVNPTSIMGGSKRVAEIVVQDLNQTYATNYIAVRFGNVLGSAGSVVPIFSEQIRKGEALTVTHKDMTRYFMTIPEASQLVLQAGALGAGGEIFVLDMGEPVKILDLAEDMIRLSGLTPYEDVDIVFTGIRDGEKLFEELEITGENLLKTRHPKIFVGKIATYAKDEVARMLSAFQLAVTANNEATLRLAFNKFLPEASITNSDEATADEQAVIDNKFFTQPANLSLAEK